MKTRMIGITFVGSAALALAACAGMEPGPQSMSFFITSAGPGNGADLGGLAGPTGTASRSPRPPDPAARPGAPT